MTALAHLKLLPQPQQLTLASGAPWQPGTSTPLALSPAAQALGPIIQDEAAALGLCLSQGTATGTGFSFTLGAQPPAAEALSVPARTDGYGLAITSGGVRVSAHDYRGLVYGWQTLKQLLRAEARTVPALSLSDYPLLPWRLYHLDLKGTRWNRQRLYSIIPLIAELKLNGLVVEYEDYLRLERHPSLAIPEALSPDEWRAWIEHAERYGIAVIPLVQTLGHWQYVLKHPAYEHLQEQPGNTGEGCASHPGSFALAKDFIDEIIAMHPKAPFIHVGLDETFNIGTCPRCVARLNGRPRLAIYMEWMTQITDYVRSRGQTPILWGDMIVGDLSPEIERQLHPNQILVDWGYHTTGFSCPTVHFHGTRLSREWLKRPAGNPFEVPNVPFGGRGRFWEDLPAADRERLAPVANHPEFPKQFYSHPAIPLLRQRGLRVMGAAASRSSNHGVVYPRFMLGQMNCLDWVQTCLTHGGEGVVATSWARGHSFTCANAHPEMDWYAVATLGAAGWGTLNAADLREFDACFAWQFLGLPDGHLGDLLYLLERTDMRVDHTMTNYLEHVAAELPALCQAATRNQHWLATLAALVDIQRLRYRGQFGLLELEYFYPVWQGVPVAFRERIGRDLEAAMAEMANKRQAWAALFAQSLLERDAVEMLATQFDFIRDGVAMFHQRLYRKPG